ERNLRGLPLTTVLDPIEPSPDLLEFSHGPGPLVCCFYRHQCTPEIGLRREVQRRLKWPRPGRQRHPQGPTADEHGIPRSGGKEDEIRDARHLPVAVTVGRRLESPG